MPKLAEMQSGQEISGVFTIQHAEMRHFADKPGRYLRLRVSDDSGIMTAVCFDPDLIPFQLRREQRITIKNAKVEEFKGELRLQFYPGSIHRLPDGV